MPSAPETPPLLTISAFARAVDLAPSTLRFYDECGLLLPTEVDWRTGYRYYTPDLERRAHLVRRMREIGLSVEVMRQVLDGPRDDATRLLREYASTAAESARQVDAVLRDVLAEMQEGPTRGRSAVTINLDGPQFGVALERVARAADPAPGSPLHVVLLEATASGLAVVATDRYWMVSWNVPGRSTANGERVALPLAEVKALCGWLSRAGTITLNIDGASIRLVAGAESRTVACSDDRFPAWQMVLDGQGSPVGRVTVDRATLRAAVGSAGGSVAGGGGAVRLVVGRDRLRVSGYGLSEGRHLDALVVGPAQTLDFSGDLLEAALATTVGTDVTVSYLAADRAVRVGSAEQPACIALVMPVRNED